jgi:hypothetical protein
MLASERSGVTVELLIIVSVAMASCFTSQIMYFNRLFLPKDYSTQPEESILVTNRTQIIRIAPIMRDIP